MYTKKWLAKSFIPQSVSETLSVMKGQRIIPK